MIRYLLPEEGRFWRANLHAHSTVSDGELSPEELKELYRSHGYSVLALTDHDRFVPHGELSDDGFLFLNGVENAADEHGKPRMRNRCCDICFLALREDIRVHPLQDPEHISGDPEYAPYTPEYSAAGVNGMLRRGTENGFFTTYNHPSWSLERYDSYMLYSGMRAMEIYNHSSAADGYPEYNPGIYDDLLSRGSRLYCLATDDNHNRAPGTMHWDSFGGFTEIRAPALTYRDIAAALEAGHFYASRGPRITSLTLDTADNSVRIVSPGAKKIVCTRGGRRCRAVYAEDSGCGGPGGAVFSIDPDDIYFRITVFDEHGLTADTNAYFIEDLGIDPENPARMKE